jgi:hypothetical protein
LLAEFSGGLGGSFIKVLARGPGRDTTGFGGSGVL